MAQTVNRVVKEMTPTLPWNSKFLPRVRRDSVQAGFTLLEIMLVLAIMAMASLLVIPRLGGLEARSFSAQVREANSLLNYSRRMAVVSGQPTTATFYFGAANQSEPESRAGAVSPDFAGHWRSNGIALSYRDSTQKETAVDDQVNITFYPEGGSTGGVLVLRQDDRLAQIDVDPFTGRVATEFSDER